MNQKRRNQINEAYETLESLFVEERETLENQEDHFGETEGWQESNRILEEAECSLEVLESSLIEWEIR